MTRNWLKCVMCCRAFNFSSCKACALPGDSRVLNLPFKTESCQGSESDS